MSLVMTAEQQELGRTVSDFLAKHSSPETVRSLMKSAVGFDRSVWNRMAGELGLHGLAVPERYGGHGYGAVELLTVFEQLGRALAGAPLLGSVGLAAAAVTAADDDDAARDLLPGLADGSTIGALAFSESPDWWNPGRAATTAVADGTGYSLTGDKHYVVDGADADVVLVTAQLESGLSLFAVDASDGGLRKTALDTLDLTRRQVNLSLSATPARLIGSPGAAGPAVRRALDNGLMLLAAEAVGVAQACLDMTVDYAKTRVQFGRRIGSFQAVKHRLADMLVAVETARVSAYEAARLADEEPQNLTLAAAAAKAQASQAAVFCSTEMIQLHGGIGFTWEHDAHLYYRRAHSTALLFGDVAYQHERIAQMLGV